MLRKHQSDLKQTIDEIISGSGIRTIVVNATPGAGKSMLPIISGKLIKAGMADKIAWIVPRKSLQDQAERNYLDPFFRDLLGHNLTIRASTNDTDPCRGLNGLVTTYQAVGMSNDNLVRDFKRKRYILVLDEFHHAEAEGTWALSLAPLVQKAAFVIMMTGTMTRGDREDIAFLKYRSGKPVFDADTKYIEYGRTVALKERAIIPLRFSLSDAQAAWTNKGVKVEVESIAGVYRPKDISAAIYTAVRTDFAKALLNAGLTHWHQYRVRAGHNSAFLVVTADVKHAKQVLKYLKARGLDAEIATSHDSPQAHKAIRDYKAGKFSILVSVAMASEGLDVPRVTHLACLTNIRSAPWIEQALARAVRVDRSLPYEQQEAYIYAPDDPLFRRIVNGIKAEQSAVAGKSDLEIERGESTTENGTKEPDVIPIGSSLTGDRSIFLGGPGGYREPAPMPKTPTEIEAETRKDIEEHIRKFCFKNRYKPQKINTEIKKHFGKARPEMTLDELGKTRTFVRQNYPLAPAVNHTPRPGISRPRGRGRRVSSMGTIVEPPQQGSLWEARAF